MPNGKYLDILPNVINLFIDNVQYNDCDKESGGYLIGYEESKTGNVVITSITLPKSRDKQTRNTIKLVDHRHQNLLSKEQTNKCYYLGLWHTHPEDIPHPSKTDIDDWNRSINNEIKELTYIYYVIIGRMQMRIWVGDNRTKEINEIFECSRGEKGLYEKD